MAKVEGPLMSMEARGKIADAIVFFPWKGRHVVRQWLVPINKKSTKQGYVRAAVFAIGKFISNILCVSSGDALNSKVYALATSAVPAGMNWNAFLGGGFLNAIQSAGTLNTALFASFVADYSALGTEILAAFQTQATAVGLADFAFDYGYVTNIEAGCQLYFGALACYSNSLTAAAPYNVDPKSWAVTHVDAFGSAMIGTA